MTHNKNQLEAHEATVEHSLRMIARVDTVLFLAGCIVSILGGMYGLFCLIG
jgi:hypothetical protein